jgi:hypothetical protein
MDVSLKPCLRGATGAAHAASTAGRTWPYAPAGSDQRSFNPRAWSIRSASPGVLYLLAPSRVAQARQRWAVRSRRAFPDLGRVFGRAEGVRVVVRVTPGRSNWPGRRADRSCWTLRPVRPPGPPAGPSLVAWRQPPLSGASLCRPSGRERSWPCSARSTVGCLPSSSARTRGRVGCSRSAWESAREELGLDCRRKGYEGVRAEPCRDQCGRY